MPTKTKPTEADEIRRLAMAESAAGELRNRVDADGKPVPPDAAYFETVEALFAAYSPPAIPFARAAMAKWQASIDEIQQLRSVDAPYRPESIVWTRYWANRDAAHAALFKEPPRLKPRPTPKALRDQGATLRTIALEWRWFDPETGLPDTDRVQHELDEPGSELTPAAIRAREQWHLEQLGYVLPADEIDS